MSFDLASFARAVPNSSSEFGYYENNARRFSTAKSVSKKSRRARSTMRRIWT